MLEEAVRFLFNDARLAAELKSLRHDFAATLAALPGPAIELHRDTPGDVGTGITMPSEQSRGDVESVVVAAGKRLSESLRSLEEYGKVIDASFAVRIESLRYRGYALESALHHRFGSGRARQWRLCVLITASLCTHHDWLTVARLAMEAGADCIQLREKSLDAGLLLDRARQLVALAEKLGPVGDHASKPAIIINDRPDVALAAGADGVHLGQTDLPLAAARRLVGRALLIGVSTGDLSHARAAVEGGADYCGVGPMFATTTKHKPILAGPDYLREYIQHFPGTPHLAIGGISPAQLPALRAAGVRGVAVSSAICAAAEPGRIVAELCEQLGQPANE